ncbi:hypothetical protein NM688_g1125 [Phlebia brevispora]|uniref:Uncharacterized protein n=1 Tax=Phlebia brevispora TaxID=194682 RepID=A0ACC1TCP7_9APHY|nr:hypothetical protein NM688_g1125 [Phlebia brevispora]
MAKFFHHVVEFSRMRTGRPQRMGTVKGKVAGRTRTRRGSVRGRVLETPITRSTKDKIDACLENHGPVPTDGFAVAHERDVTARLPTRKPLHDVCTKNTSCILTTTIYNSDTNFVEISNDNDFRANRHPRGYKRRLDVLLVWYPILENCALYSSSRSPFARFGVFPVGGRSTAVKLRNGDVWVLASTPLNDVTKSKLNEIGPVKWIVGADAVHHLFLGEFKKEYPSAKLLAVEEAIQKKKGEGLVFDGAWGADPVGTKYGFEDDIQHCESLVFLILVGSYFSGHQNKDVAFFHPASKSLIEADLLFNLPPTEQYSKARWSGNLPFLSNHLNPFGMIHKRFVWATGVDKDAMRRDARTVAGWDFNRIIPCHGDVIEERGKEAWNEAFKFFLD